MKNAKVFFIKLIVIYFYLISSGCTKIECSGEDEIVNYKFTPELLSFFPYHSNDTLEFEINNLQFYHAVSYQFTDKIITEKVVKDFECGSGIVYNRDWRFIKYYDSNNETVAQFTFELTGLEFMKISWIFPNTEARISAEIYFNTDEELDTLTIDSKFYDDVFIKKNEQAKEEYYYSKSHGLVKVVEDGKVVFKLL